MANIQGLVINGSVIKNDGETSGDIDLEKPYKIGKIGDNDVYEVWVCNQLNPLKYDPQYFYNKIIDCSDIPNFTYISLLFSELITNYTEDSNGNYTPKKATNAIKEVVFDTKNIDNNTHYLFVNIAEKQMEIIYNYAGSMNPTFPCVGYSCGIAHLIFTVFPNNPNNF